MPLHSATLRLLSFPFPLLGCVTVDAQAMPAPRSMPGASAAMQRVACPLSMRLTVVERTAKKHKNERGKVHG